MNEIILLGLGAIIFISGYILGRVNGRNARRKRAEKNKNYLSEMIRQ